ncbi:transposase [Paraburkholderia aspalathi]|uniref:transposase n=1 Tax=Paraburkholderia aspalathi TaxID=1324617 RepID=UPI003556979F
MTDEQWAMVESLFQGQKRRSGRPRRSDREILDAIIWIHQRGEKWHRLPETFPPQQTCYARYIAWKHSGLLAEAFAIFEIVGCGY